MARYYRRRYTRVVKPKKKWATNIRQWTYDSTTAGEGGQPVVLAKRTGLMTKLCVNSAVDSNPTPVILKVGNFKVQMDLNMLNDTNGLTAAEAYVMYLPEGIQATGANLDIDYGLLSGTIERHPEWILAWKQIAFDKSSANINFDKITFSSKLKRNLNSGDCIALCVLFDSPNEVAPREISFRAVSQFWTCAN